MSDTWPSMSIETGICDPLRSKFSRIENKSRKIRNIEKLKAAAHLKKRRKKIEAIEEIGEDDKPILDQVPAEELINSIKLEVEDAQKAQVINEHIPNNVLSGPEDSFEIAAEVELSTMNLAEYEDSEIKVEKQTSNLKPTEEQPDWNDSNNQYNSYGLSDHSKNMEYIVSEDASVAYIQQGVCETEPKETEPIEVTNDPVPDKSNERDNTTFAVEEEVNSSELVDVVSEGDKPSIKYNNSTMDCLLHDYTTKSDSKMYEFQMKIYSYSTKLNVRTWVTLFSSMFNTPSKLKMYRCWCIMCRNNLQVIQRNWKSVMAFVMKNSEETEGNIKNFADLNGYTYENSLEDLKAIAEGEKGDILYWEAEVENLLKMIEEIVREDCESSNLPLKKRKAFSTNSASTCYGNGSSNAPLKYDTPETSSVSSHMIVPDEKLETSGTSYPPCGAMVNNKAKTTPPISSYPCTPMLSIAELEVFRHKINNSAGIACTADPTVLPTTYVLPPPYASYPVYPGVNDPKYSPMMVQAAMKDVLPAQSIHPAQALLPDGGTTSFLSINQGQECSRKFKTPAQLKEEIYCHRQNHKRKFKTPAELKEEMFSYGQGFEDLYAAQGLIDFANQEEPTNRRQTRQKNKSRKRKRN